MPQTDARLKDTFRTILSEYYEYIDEDAIGELFLAARPHKNPTAQQQMLEAICHVFGVNANLNAPRYVRLASDLLKENFSPASIREEYLQESEARTKRGNYWDHDWRGQRGEWPKEVSLRETIERAVKGWPAPEKRANGTTRSGMLGVDV